jgi:hypothetical protein
MLDKIFWLFPHCVANNFSGPDAPVVSRSSPAPRTFVANSFHCSPNVSPTFERAVLPNHFLRTNELKSGEERSAAPSTFRSTFVR